MSNLCCRQWWNAMRVREKLKKLRAQWLRKIINYKAKRPAKKLHREPRKVAK